MKGKLAFIAMAFLVLTLLLPPGALAAPLAPAGLTAVVVSATQVDLAWTDSSTDESGFRIERSTDGVVFATVGTAAADTQTFTDATVLGTGVFSYRVIATNATGHSAPSNVVSVTLAIPNAPSGLAAILAGGPTGPQVNVTWADNSDNETGFRIERSGDNFATPPSDTFAAAANATAFSDATVVRPHTYYYRVVAVNVAGDSAASNSAAAGWVGPIDPAFIFQGNPNSSFPGYYADSQGTRVALLPTDGPPAPQQVFEDVDQANPYSVFLGMGEEGFYYIAEASFNTAAGIAKSRFAIEANTAAPGDEVVFTRTRLFAKVPAAGTYKFVHPYGEETIEVTQDDVDTNRGIRFTNDVGLATRSFHLAAAAQGPIDGFLHQTTPLPPAGWIGDGVSLGPVTGSPTGFNKVRLVAPQGVNLDGAGNNVVETDQFSVAARLQTTVAPSPSFTKSHAPTSCVVSCTVTLTDTSTGAPTARSWDFGDGTNSTLQSPSKTYNAAGTYTITLTVTNAGGTGSVSQTVDVYSTPVASFTKTLPSGLPPVAITFTDTSTGNPTGWSWSFGDGTSSTLRNPTKVYALAGTYNVTLMVTNPAGSASTTQTVGISNALVPAFTASALVGVAPLTVDFADTSTGTITSRSWDFGDGSPASTVQNPTHIYSSAGDHTVTLTVTDSAGSAAALQTVSVYVAPVASFTKSAASGPPPLVVTFADTSTGNPTSRFWTFGDGTTSNLQNPRKAYAAAGVYPVTLTVANPAGSAFATQTVAVSGAFAAPGPLSLQVGPIDPEFIFQGDPNTSFPGYYQDDQGTRVALLPITGDGLTAPTQIYEPVDPEDPYSVFLGMGEEAFYWIATADFTTMGGTGRGHARFAVEANFAGPGGEVVFTRTRFRLDVPVPGDYTIEHPYGTHTFTITQDDIDARGGLFFTEDVGLAERDFLLAATGPIARFLRQSNPPPPEGWIGDGASVGTVTGSPTGFNKIRVTGPVGVNLDGSGGNVVETDRFSVAARLQTAVAPVASFTKTLDPANCFAPCTVTITDTSTGAPEGWSWDFGDGSTSTVQNPSKTYDTGGTYAITLTAANAVGTSSTAQTVTVYNAPVAGFTKSAAAGIAPLIVKFNDTSTGNVVTWSWDFGDGTTSTLQDPTRVFAKAGTHTVTLTVTNPLGTASTSQTVTVASVPAPATGLSATLVNATQIDLAWTDNATNELGLFVQRSTNGADFATLATLPADAVSYPDTDVVAGAGYAYRIVAFNVAGDSLPSNVAAVNLTAPAAPSNLGLANPAVTQVDLGWTDNADNETGFRVERSTDGASFALAGNVAAGVTAFSDTAVTQDTIYTYRVFAVNALGDSGPSNTLQVSVGVPAAPSTLTASVNSPPQVDLTWVDAANTETGFRVERSTDGNAFTVLSTTAANAQGYSDTTAAKNTTYWYRVFAFNTIGDSASSNVVQATTPNTIPGRPTGLSATPANPDRVTLTWTDSSDNETSFLIERSTGGAGFAQVVRLDSTTINTAGTQVSYTDTGLVGRTTYTYRVKAGNELGDSPASDPATVTTPNVFLTGLTSPTGVTVDAAGVVQANATVTDNSGKGKLDVAQGTRLRAKNGQPLTTLTAAPLAAPPQAPPQNTVVLAVDFGPDGADFNPPLTVTMTYNPATLPAGVREDKLRIAFWDGAGWIKLNSTVNTATKTITAKISHFTAIGLLGEQEPPPTAIPTPAPTATPIPAPRVIAEAQVVPVPQQPGETSTIVQPTTEVRVELEDKTVITVPPLAMPVTVQMRGRNVAEKDLPKLPTKGKVRKVVEIEVFDDKGVKIESVEIRVPITIEVPLSADDLAEIGDDPNNVELHRYDNGTKTWVKLASELDLAKKVVRAQLRHLSLFAVVVPAPVTQAQPTPTAAPPSAGGQVPGSSAWLVALVIGLGILLFGYRLLRGAREPVRKE